MKRAVLVLVLVLFCLSLAAVAADDSTKTVYITNTGKCYHADGCKCLAKSKTAIVKKDAIAKGYRACSICKP
jgi:hypothetical protein